MGEVVYESEVTIERKSGAVRHARLPAEEAPVVFGVHGAVAEHYGVSEEEIDPRATTIDYVVAAAAG